MTWVLRCSNCDDRDVELKAGMPDYVLFECNKCGNHNVEPTTTNALSKVNPVA